MTSIDQLLQFRLAERREHFLFNFLSFLYFKDTAGDMPLFASGNWLLASIRVVPYLIAMELILFRANRYFVMLGDQTVGIFVVRPRGEALYLGSLAVASQYRGLGIATRMLACVDTIARQLDLEWVKLQVYKLNLPGLRLYKKLGFAKMGERRWSLILRKRVAH